MRNCGDALWRRRSIEQPIAWWRFSQPELTPCGAHVRSLDMNDVLLIRPPDSFGPADHHVLASVAQGPGSKILDLTRLPAVPINIAAIVTAGWSAPKGSVARLAIVLELDVWAVARMMTAEPIGRLREQGTDLRVLYRTQLEAGLVHVWIKEGLEPAGELTRTLEQLDTVWAGSPLAANVVDAYGELVAADESPSKPLHLARLASIALKFCDQRRSLDYARKALRATMDRSDAVANHARALAQAVSQKLLAQH